MYQSKTKYLEVEYNLSINCRCLFLTILSFIRAQVRGLGHVGVKVANALCIEVSVLNHALRNHALRNQEYGLRMGADDATADLIINRLSIESKSDNHLSHLQLDGTMVVVGNSGKKSPVSPSIKGRRRLVGSVIG